MTIGELTFGVHIAKDVSLLDVDVLLSHVLKQPREYLYTHPEKKLTKKQGQQFTTLLKRRNTGEPIAYLVGKKEFFGRDFFVTPDVLIPRPDTELLVEIALHWLEQQRNPQTVLDLGTGSGIIPITLAMESAILQSNAKKDQHTFLGSDISGAAIRVARKNAKSVSTGLHTKHLPQITMYTSNLFQRIPKQYQGKLNMITFNAPYLTKTEARKQKLAYEPQVALTPTGKPTSLYDAMLQEAPKWLAPKGLILFEIGHRQAKQVSELCQKYFPASTIVIHKDLGGFDRVVYCQT